MACAFSSHGRNSRRAAEGVGSGYSRRHTAPGVQGESRDLVLVVSFVRY